MIALFADGWSTRKKKFTMIVAYLRNVLVVTRNAIEPTG
jgi:hypothetical protein